MTQTPSLTSFDPFGNHAFTNMSCLPASPPRTAYAHTPSTSPKSPSCSSTRSPSRKVPPSPAHPVFVPYRHERSKTPDLSDIMAKRPSSFNLPQSKS
ncbi:hypothetical protein BDV98DRAFT_21026 [Pterulicium gracile]|uniref:Uncharacterized protein n=1 Tax=Pterulicium gracile TaxID=1884261 RepID=A0A5C3R3P0_9AGAR|nr:hypothetical protein BDV98DRAFT_21026 [Pterula gracilis]